MILSRITKAVREQNWFAVTIEFVIVILGVVIGFQISAWNTERQAEARVELALIRLQAETEETIRTLRNRIAVNAERQADQFPARADGLHRQAERIRLPRTDGRADRHPRPGRP